MRILAIESSCDETSIALVDDGTRVLCNIIGTSQAAFTASGGVIPEEAARKQVECILPVLHQALEGTDWSAVDAIAVTKGPGLLGSLLVGTMAARVLASVFAKPLIGVHHTLGHLTSTWLKSPEFASSDARNTRPVTQSSTALEMPTMRGRNHDEQASGTMPRRANTKPIFAPSTAMRMSIGSVIVIPTPTAGPLMAAMTGLSDS